MTLTAAINASDVITSATTLFPEDEWDKIPSTEHHP